MAKIHCDLTKDQLEKLYIEEHRTLEEMCVILGCKSPITARKILHEKGISTNANQRHSQKTMHGMSDSEFSEFLKSSYESGLSMNQIADRVGISASGIRKYFIKYGIARRNNAGYSSIDSSYAVNWKGGKNINANGYVEIKVPGHPNLSKRGYIYEHQYVMEQYIGRYLKPGEVIHHIDGNKQNNDISNLLLLTNSEHAKLHAILRNSEKRMKRGDN